MLGLKKKLDLPVFVHEDDCGILAADPGVQIPWNEVSAGHFVATCACVEQHFYAPTTKKRTKIDPLDPKMAHHLGQCEIASETDPVAIKRVLRVREGVGGEYRVVECSSCLIQWNVPLYEESVG